MNPSNSNNNNNNSKNNNKKKWFSRGGKVYNGKYKKGFSRSSVEPSTSNDNDDDDNNENNSNFINTSSYYIAWNLYFPEEAFIENSPLHRKIISFENFIQRNINLYSFSKIEDNRWFGADLSIINKDEQFKEEWPNFLEELNMNSEFTLKCLSLAMHQLIVNDLKDQSMQNGHDFDLERVNKLIIRARILNHEPIIHLKNLKVQYFGKMISVRGTVIRVSNVKLICRSMCFKCHLCGTKQITSQPDGVFTQPTKCKSKGCRAVSKFIPLLSSKHTQTDNWQVLKLQEQIGSDNMEGGRIPRTVECELADDLVDSCVPGDDVTVTGIIKVRNSEDYNKSKQASIFSLYIDAVSVTNNKHESQVANTTHGIEFNQKDYYAIQQIHAEPNLFRLLVHSLCPGIFGHEMIKAGLLLGLFGGAAKEARGDIHVLMVGDPGLGKSQMLQACASVAPRGVLVCGNTSTSSGLTATMTRESGGEYSLEAGALVLADQGTCCIDEFDKMTSHHGTLLEAMEQQTVSIAKAGVVSTLPARTSILAAANPSGGHYNMAKTVSENLRMGAALLSRFDLVFILRDRPNQALDKLLSEHVLALHSGFQMKNKKSHYFATSTPCETNTESERENLPLQERLEKMKNEYIDVLPHQLLRKYIAYARKYVYPKLSVEATAVLKKFYLELRRKHQTTDCTPITTRQAQSLMRLTLARAKLELRETATEKDALDVVELLKYSMVDTFSDECDMIDFTRSQHGSGMSQRGKAKKLVSLLQKEAERESKSVFTGEQIKALANRHGLTDVNNLITTLNTHGFLLKKKSNEYKLLSVD